MLNVMRSNLKSLKWVLWLVAFSMVAYLGSYFACGTRGAGGSAWVARVDGTEISIRDFQYVARNIEGNYRRLFGENFDQFKSSLQIGTQAVQTLIEREMILQDARRLGLVASEEDVATQIRETFQDAEGRFIGTEEYVQRVDRGVPGGVEAFERSVAQDTLIQRWEELIAQGVSVTDAELEELFRERSVKTSIDYVVIPTAEQEVDSSADEAQERAWYEAHSEDYRRGEGRRVRYLVVDREAQLAGIEIGDEELRASYDANRQSYEHPEQRQARHILFRIEAGADEAAKQAVRERAEQALDRLDAGEPFDELARELSEDPSSASQGGDLGFFARGRMVPPFEEAVFGTPVGELAPLTETDFGVHIIDVLDERPAGAIPFEDVAEEIRRSLSYRRADEQVLAEAQRLRDEIDSANAFDAAAAAAGLSVESRLIRRGDRLGDLGAAPDLVPALFELEAGQVSGPLRVAAGMALMAVDEVLPAGVAPFEEVREVVHTDLVNDRARQAALAAGQRALAAHDAFADSASALELEVRSAELSPAQDLPGTGGLDATHRERLFGVDVAEAQRDVLPVPAGALMYEVTGRQPFDPQQFDDQKPDLRRELLQRRQGQLRQSILQKLQQERLIEVNQELVQRIDQRFAG